ncbi:FAD-dependent monooxygenase [Streptomyces sp. bgisy100]|uniref:FAD-dependent monooxygenase n=1 Tax=Streptomyces sp. bgisy100 TaxID=3413783 RepID=UPI003D708AF8
MELNNVKHADVLIAGAGPTGLALACDLTRRGIRARIVERAAALFPGSRGKGLQPRTLEVLDDLGVIEAAYATGGPLPPMVTWTDGRRGDEWDMIPRGEPTPTAPYGEALMLPQWRTQEILYTRLRELGGEVHFSTGLTGFTQDADGVTATLTRADGSVENVRAAYLIAADGGRSTVRKALGIGMTGETVDPEPMLVADVRADGIDRLNWHVWPHSPAGVLMMCPLAGTDTFQIYARYSDGSAPDLSPEGIRAVVAERTHLAEGNIHEVLWASDFRARAAMADHFRSGRVFLAGDAAHIHSPAGAQGLNTSVQDAYNLGWKLGLVLQGLAGPELLDTYEEERIPIAAGVLGISTDIHRAMLSAPRDVMPRRDAGTQQLGLGYRDGSLAVERRSALPEGALRAGDRAPDAPLPDGSRLFDLFRGPHFTLLAFGTAELPPVDGATIHAHRVPADAPIAREAYAEHGLFLIRPDGYVALATHDPSDLAAHPAWPAAPSARGASRSASQGTQGSASRQPARPKAQA